jgi:uncharacterized integral membrane protein
MARNDNEQSVLQRLGAKGIAGIVLAIIAVVFIVENNHRTKVRFIVPEVSAPLWLALLIAVALGAVAGGLVVHRRSK